MDLQGHSRRTKSPPFKHTVLTFVTDNALPPRRANAATALTVTSASVQTILTAQAAVIPKSVIKANWNEKKYSRFSEHPDKIIPPALTCSRCTSAKRKLHIKRLKKPSIRVVSVQVGSVANTTGSSQKTVLNGDSQIFLFKFWVYIKGKLEL